MDGLYAPTTKVLKAVRRAAMLPTGLEVDSPEELKALRITGQATAIANLLEYLEAKHGRVRSNWPLAVLELDGRLREDSNTLNTDGEPLRPRGDMGHGGRGRR